MKEESFSFTLADFLAYLFPGTMMILAVAAFLKLTPFKHLLYEITPNLVTGLLLIGCAYFAGVAVSSLMVGLEKAVLKSKNPTFDIPLQGFEKEVEEAFNSLFGVHGNWSDNHYYISRAFVVEKMPNCAKLVERQSSLRQMRRNSILPVMFLGLAGILAGVKITVDNSQRDILFWGVSISFVSLLASSIVIRNLVKAGMFENRGREVREVYSGLLVYYYQSKANGVLNYPNSSAQVNKSPEVISQLRDSEDALQSEAARRINGGDYPLTILRRLATDMGMPDLAARHDQYAHGRLKENDDPVR